METAGNHEVKDEPETVVEFEDDAFAYAVEGADRVVFDLFDARLYGAEEKWAGDAEMG